VRERETMETRENLTRENTSKIIIITKNDERERRERERERKRERETAE
jgi:hypothetical protein